MRTPDADDGPFAVYIFFPDGSHHCEGSFTEALEAVQCAKRQTEKPAVLLGMIRRVIITDGGDFTCFEWKHGEGVTYPPAPKQTEQTA